MSRPTWTQLLTRARKTGVALLGALAVAAAVTDQALQLGVLPDDVARWAPVLIALATAAGVYRATNTGTVPTDRLDEVRRLAYSRGRLDQIAGAPHPDHQPGTAHGTARAWEAAPRRTE